MVKTMPSPVHECVQHWFQHVINHMQQDGFINWRNWLNRIARNAGMGEFSSSLTKTQANVSMQLSRIVKIPIVAFGSNQTM